jgi:broad specificity phosphatase PhoE
VERGYTDENAQFDLRKVHGGFYYRHSGGESPADCYDRTSAFLESMMRGAEGSGATKFVIVTHGMTIRCFVMRFLHLSVEQFESMHNPEDCNIVTIGPIDEINDPVFRSARWGVSGMRLRD